MRKIFTIMLVLMLLPGMAGAEVLRQTNEETGYIAAIEDSAGLLDSAEYADVMATMMGITEYCNAGLYTCSSREYVGNNAEAWANRMFTGHCTLFIIDMTSRQLMVWSSDDIMKTLTQSKCYTITDNVSSYATKKQYARCFITAFNQMLNALKGGKVTGPMRSVSNALIALLAAILLAYLLISARMEQEVKVHLPDVVTATVGAGAVIAAKTLVRKVRNSSSSGGSHGGFHSGGGFHGGGFSGGGGGFHGGGGSHGF